MDNQIVLIIAGTAWQIPLIEKIREMGFLSLVINPHPESIAFKYADYWELADILHLDACLAIAKQYNVVSVVSDQCDIAVPTVAFIAEKMGFRSLKQSSAKLFTNKYCMREFCRFASIKYPSYALCRSPSDVVDFFNIAKGEIVVKPLDANSSRGVHTINLLDNIKASFEDAIAFSRCDQAVLAETYIEGPEFTVDGIVIKGKHYSLAISVKSHYDHNRNIAKELLFMHFHELYDYDELRRINDNLIEKSGLEEGTLTHSEYKYSDGEYYLIEVAARGGGNLVASHIVPFMSGFDNYGYHLRVALGIKSWSVPQNIALALNKYSVLHFFSLPQASGKVVGIEGESFLHQTTNIIAYKLNFKIGDTLRQACDDSSRIGFYIACANSLDELAAIQRQINKTFNIKLE